MTDLLGPANAVNFTTSRPSDTRIFGGDDTWFKPCSSPSAQDGTQVQAVWLNGILAQIRRAIVGMGIPVDNADDDMLLKAIQAAAAGLATEAQLFAGMPIFPMVGTNGLIATSTSTGQIIVSTGQSIIRRGVKSYLMDDISLANRTFATAINKTYHLRWDAPGTGLATPASSWPAGRLSLRDLADSGYNPSALAETNSAFDTTYDSALLARVVTNGSNVLTVTALENRPFLKRITALTETFSRTTGISGLFVVPFTPITLNWSRTPNINGCVARIGYPSTLAAVPEEVELSFNGSSPTDGTGSASSSTDRYASRPIGLVDTNQLSTALSNMQFQLLTIADA